MKRAFALATAGLLMAMAALGGPALWSGYRFMAELNRLAVEQATEAGPWPQIQDGCALCHGPKGHAGNARYPSLAGLSAPYIEAQLRAFAAGRRHNPQMNGLAANLSDEQIRDLAVYYARQSPGPNEAVVDHAAVAACGQAAARACAACHGPRLEGSPAAPRLAGQGQAYLEDQLIAYQRGERTDPAQGMNAIAGALSADEITLLARYIAGLTPTPR